MVHGRMSKVTKDDKAVLAELEEMKLQEEATAPQSTEAVEPVTEQDKVWLKDLEAIDAERTKYSGEGEKAFALGAAGAASFGLSTRLLDKLGFSKEEQEKIRRYNKSAELAGQITGTVGATLLPGGVLGTAAKGAALPTRAAVAGGRMVEKAALSALKTKGTESAIKQIVKRSVARGAGSSVEGAAIATGQLLDENALGRAELNAENLMAYGGLGALYGGAIGTALPIAGGSIAAAAKKSKPIFGKLSDKFLDVNQAKREFLGMPKKKALKHKLDAKLEQNSNDFIENLQNKAGVKPLDSNSTISEKAMAWNKDTMTKLESVYERAAEKIRSKLKGKPDLEVQGQVKHMYIDKLADEFDDLVAERIGAGWEHTAGSGSIKKFKKYLQSLKENKSPYFEPSDIRRMRQVVDDFSGALTGENKRKAASVFFETRTKVANTLESYIRRVDEKLADELLELNRDASLYLTYGDDMHNFLLRDKAALGMKDAVIGGIGIATFGTEGALIAGARKVWESDFKRKILTLSNMEKANKATSTNMAKSIKSFFKGKSKPAELGLLVGLLNSELAENEAGKKPKNKKQAFANVQSRVQEMVKNPDELEARVSRSTAALTPVAPKAAAQAAEALTRSVLFLSSKMPVGPQPLFGGARDWEPSSMELAKFERYLEVTQNPLSVLRELEQGTLTREHVEALKAVYPAMYEELQMKTLKQVEKAEADGDSLAYAKKIQLGILLDIPTDSSLLGANLAALQTKFTIPLEEPPSPQKKATTNARGASKMEIASRSTTTAQRIEGGE
jgi:hypothetical protein